jgi:hypothetical protein
MTFAYKYKAIRTDGRNIRIVEDSILAMVRFSKLIGSFTFTVSRRAKEPGYLGGEYM